jgi:single-strand DNA-binding protein
MGLFSINDVTLVGKLGRDSETRTTTGGTDVTTFSMATDHSVKDESESSGWKNVTTWHKVVFFGLPEFQTQALRKGATVCVKGRISNRSYEKDGETKYISEVIGNKRDFIVMDSPSNRNAPCDDNDPADNMDETPF